MTAPPRALEDQRRGGAARIEVAGFQMDALDERALMERVFGDLDHGIGGWVLTPNVDILRQADKDPQLHELFSRATLKIADGAPVELAARISGQSIPGRIPGASMFWTLAREAAVRRRSILLVGGRPGAGELAVQRLVAQYPDLAIHQYCPPMGFEHDPDEMALLRREIERVNPDLIFVGLGAPKQERLIAVLRDEFPSAWFFGLGASIDFASGMVPRAPEWMQRDGVEWVYRLAQEPRRLARRYLVHGIPFTVRMLAQAARMRWSAPAHMVQAGSAAGAGSTAPASQPLLPTQRTASSTDRSPVSSGR